MSRRRKLPGWNNHFADWITCIFICTYQSVCMCDGSRCWFKQNKFKLYLSTTSCLLDSCWVSCSSDETVYRWITVTTAECFGAWSNEDQTLPHCTQKKDVREFLGAGAYLSHHWRKAGYTLGGSPVIHRTTQRQTTMHTYSYGQSH